MPSNENWITITGHRECEMWIAQIDMTPIWILKFCMKTCKLQNCILQNITFVLIKILSLNIRNEKCTQKGIDL